MIKYKDSICVVVPVYNAKETIKQLIIELTAILSRFEKYQIILIDDFSKDDSFKVIKGNISKNIMAIRFNKNYGQQMATYFGLKKTNCDYTVIIDDDLEQSPKDIIKIYKEIKKGYDVVYGINEKYNQKGFVRSRGSKIRDYLFNKLTNKPKNLKVCSFRIMNRDIVNKVIKANSKFIYISMEILKNTNNIGNIYLKYTSNNNSNYKFSTLIRLFMKIYIYYSNLLVFKMFRKDIEQFEIGEII